MTPKSIIIALLVMCASLFAETPASVFADSLDQGTVKTDSSVDHLWDLTAVPVKPEIPVKVIGAFRVVVYA